MQSLVCFMTFWRASSRSKIFEQTIICQLWTIFNVDVNNGNHDEKRSLLIEAARLQRNRQWMHSFLHGVIFAQAVHLMSDCNPTISALIEIADDEANPDDLRVRALYAVMPFITPPFEVPDVRAVRRLKALLRKLLQRLDQITPAQAPVRKLPTPSKWLN